MKGKKINFDDIKNSPYTSAVALVLVMLLVVAGNIYFIIGILDTKDKIVETRESYKKNLQEIAVLEEMRAQSEKAEAQLEVYKGILPDELGDIYILQEEVVATCRSFGLEVSTIEATQVPAQTQETVFVFNVQGTFANLYNYMAYISELEQMHRFDAVSINKGEGDKYAATISLAILSQNGADGVVSAVIDAATEAVTESATTES